MSTTGAGGNHSGDKSTASNFKSMYKNASLDSQELRRRREEEGIQLRKQKRDQQLAKRRNVNTTELLQVRIQIFGFKAAIGNVSLTLFVSGGCHLQFRDGGGCRRPGRHGHFRSHHPGNGGSPLHRRFKGATPGGNVNLKVARI